MKKTVIIFVIILMLFGVLGSNVVLGADRAIDTNTESRLVQMRENESRALADFQVRYGSDTYGFVAYVLHLVRIYSIPFCFLGIVLGAIYQYVIGIRKLDTLSKGMGLIVMFVTLLVIAQILPLAFAVFVQFNM